MLYKRVVLIRAGAVTAHNQSPIIPPAHEVRYIIIKNVKRYGLVVIAVILRISIRSSIHLKKGSAYLTKKVRNTLSKHFPEKKAEERETSGFLKTVSEYKRKISNLKEKIKEEEKEY